VPVDLVRGLISRWPQPDPKHVPLLKQAAIDAVMLEQPDAAFSQACQAAGIETVLAGDWDWLDAKGLAGPRSGKPLALKEGAWPGVAKEPVTPGRGDETASASRDPWIEINGYWVQYLRALMPGRPAVLGYTPDLGNRGVPFDTLELALVEARAMGGNYLLAVEPMFREALLAGQDRAMTAWRHLGATVRWLREQDSLLGQPVDPAITLLVEPGETTPEIAKLMYRRIASPALAPAARPPLPDRRVQVLVAVDLQAPTDEMRRRILAHAESGAIVVVNGTGWPTARMKAGRKQEDREFYALGKGQVVVYRGTIDDPSEFSMDVIDLLTHKRRPARIWAAPTLVAVAAGARLMYCVNYGSPIDVPVQVRRQGVFTRATLLRPGAAPLTLKASRRGTTTEVMLPELRRLGILVFG
jgi:hypothetical protein